MGHKGVSKKKPKKIKIKPLATANRRPGVVSSIVQPGVGADQLPEKASTNLLPGSKKNRRKR